MKLATLVLFVLPTVAAFAAGNDAQNSIDFSAIQKETPGKAIVVFYADVSPAIFNGAQFEVQERGAPVGRFVNQTYLVMAVVPGEHAYSFGDRASVGQTIQAEQGQVYFLRAVPTSASLVHRDRLQVSTAAEMAQSLPVLRNILQPAPVIGARAPFGT